VSRWATFDCYGTLIDWDTGIGSTLGRLWPNENAERLLGLYHDLEPVVQEERPTAPYRDVLAETLRRLAKTDGLVIAETDGDALGAALPSWPPFPEVPAALVRLRDQGFRLGILSNTDLDLLEASIEQLGVPIDERVVASEIGSYKPAHAHWQVFFERTGARRDQHVHVAAGLFHDIRPAKELGLATVWINRLDEQAYPEPDRELPDLSQLPEVLEELCPLPS